MRLSTGYTIKTKNWHTNSIIKDGYPFFKRQPLNDSYHLTNNTFLVTSLPFLMNLLTQKKHTTSESFVKKIITLKNRLVEFSEQTNTNLTFENLNLLITDMVFFKYFYV
jgi:hypothetical protein